jgi:hypothetical protein
MWIGASSGSSGPAPPGVTCYYQHLFCRTHYISSWRPRALGAHHRRLQLRWWLLPDLPPAPPGGPPSTASTTVVAAAENLDSTPQGARHQCLQLRLWPLLKILTAPPGGLPSASSTTVVAAAGPAASFEVLVSPPSLGLAAQAVGCCSRLSSTPSGTRAEVEALADRSSATIFSARGMCCKSSTSKSFPSLCAWSR